MERSVTNCFANLCFMLYFLLCDKYLYKWFFCNQNKGDIQPPLHPPPFPPIICFNKYKKKKKFNATNLSDICCVLENCYEITKISYIHCCNKFMGFLLMQAPIIEPPFEATYLHSQFNLPTPFTPTGTTFLRLCGHSKYLNERKKNF